MAREEMNLTTVCPMIAGQNQPNNKATKIVESSGAPIRLDKMTRRRKLPPVKVNTAQSTASLTRKAVTLATATSSENTADMAAAANVQYQHRHFPNWR